jgi:hypothetical protein
MHGAAAHAAAAMESASAAATAAAAAGIGIIGDQANRDENKRRQRGENGTKHDASFLWTIFRGSKTAALTVQQI